MDGLEPHAVHASSTQGVQPFPDRAGNAWVPEQSTTVKQTLANTSTRAKVIPAGSEGRLGSPIELWRGTRVPEQGMGEQDGGHNT